MGGCFISGIDTDHIASPFDRGRVELAEISGSDTFVHVATPLGELVAQLTGVHDIALGAALVLYLDPRQVHVFDREGALLLAPQFIAEP